MSKRVYNFYAGPATLPENVLKIAQTELLNYQNSGMSIMEMSHRSPSVEKVMSSAEQGVTKHSGKLSGALFTRWCQFSILYGPI